MKLAILISSDHTFPKQQVKTACRLAKRLSVPLTGIISTEHSTNYHLVGDGGYLAMMDEVSDIARQKLQKSIDKFKSVCADEKVAQDWSGTYGFIRHEWETLSPYFDLAITTGDFSAPEFADVGISATLQINETSKIDGFDGRCVIAWDGSLQAGRAIRAALPLMTRFADVVVISIDAESRSLPTDIGSYLAAHGIKAEILSLVSGGDTVAHVLLDESRNADLVVMGAYGFSSTLEKWFGGVTETMRTECKTPVLFAR